MFTVVLRSRNKDNKDIKGFCERKRTFLVREFEPYMGGIEEEFNIFIPVNELVWRVKKLLVKSVSDIIKTSLDLNSQYVLINKNPFKEIKFK